MARRGYDPEAVDAHLSAIAAEVEQLGQSVRPKGESLASAASAQVRAIVEAAEATAAQIRADAEHQSGLILSEARSEAKAAQARAAAQAGERVDQVSKSAVGMLERIEAIDQELSALLDALRAGATRLNGELAQLQGSLRDATVSAPEPEVAAPPPPEPEVAAPPLPEPELAAPPPPAAAAPSGPPRTAAKAGSDDAAARLIALNMAIKGSTRDEVAQYLSEHYELSDPASLLDEVFASVED